MTGDGQSTHIVSDEELENYAPELRSVVQRHGPELFKFASIVAGTNAAVDEVIALGERYVKLRGPGVVLTNNLSALCQDILDLHNWNMDQVIECMNDIGRAHQLAERPKIILH